MSAFELYEPYQFLWFFIVYAFLGWCTEVAYAAVCRGIFVNRGFLNGPVCPVYGFGMVLVIAALTPLADDKLLLFGGAFILTSVLEWVTGFVLEKCFHDKWWDYSDMPFNLHGYICLKFSIMWGLACVLIMDILHPAVVKMVGWIPRTPGFIAVVFLLVLLAVDTGVTAASIMKWNRKMEHMNEIAKKMREVSDRLGASISEDVLDLMEKSEEVREIGGAIKQELREDMEEEFEKRQAELQREAAELRRRYEELAERRTYIHRRIVKAFPDMKSKIYEDILEDIKGRYNL